jgi:hypothetical protein
MKKTAFKKKRGFKRTENRYGPLWDEVKRERCFGLKYISGHECGIGVRPWTAHHLGRLDEEGLCPVCAKLHDMCHDQPWKVTEALEKAGSPTLEEIGQLYVEKARQSIMGGLEE